MNGGAAGPGASGGRPACRLLGTDVDLSKILGEKSGGQRVVITEESICVS